MKFSLIGKIIDTIVPTENNKFHPYALRRSSLFSYAVFLILINLFGGFVFGENVGTVSAASFSTDLLVKYVNEERANRGLVVLRQDSKLEQAAFKKGQDMLAKDYWSHYGPAGETPWQFILRAGYSYIYAGENLAKDFHSEDAVHAAWMASPTHRENILKSQYRDVGIAAVTGEFNGSTTTIIVQMFGTTTESDIKDQQLVNLQDTALLFTTPEITSPEDGGYYNDSLLNVMGRASQDSEVTIYEGNQKLGTLSTEGGIFDYRPMIDWLEGSHSIFAVAKDVRSGDVSKKSEEVEFNIDNTVPVLNPENIDIIYHEVGDSLQMDISIIVWGADTVDLIVKGKSYPLDKSDQITEEGETEYLGLVSVPKKDVAESNSRAEIVVSDLAGNTINVEVELPIVSDKGEVKGVFSIVNERISSLGAISKMNVLFATILMILLVLDVIVLWKRGVIREGSRSLFATFIFAVVILTGVFVGGQGALV